MTLASDTNEPLAADWVGADVEDYVALLKPRVMSLVVFTALVGMVVAHPAVHPVIAFGSLLMIAVGAGASGCLNMWWDAAIDAVMVRTRKRPIPAGRFIRWTASAHLIRGSSSQTWKGGGEESCHSSVVAPSPQGFSAITRLRLNASKIP